MPYSEEIEVHRPPRVDTSGLDNLAARANAAGECAGHLMSLANNVARRYLPDLAEMPAPIRQACTGVACDWTLGRYANRRQQRPGGMGWRDYEW